MFKRTVHCIFFIGLLGLVGVLKAQNEYNSPYSRYGIGDLLIGKGMKNNALGGVAMAFRDPCSVNPLNPSSYTVFDSMSFVFETGLYSRYSQLSSTVSSQNNFDIRLANMIFGFPINRKIGASFGLMPYSEKSYNLIETQNIPAIGQVERQYNGSGGVHQIYYGMGYKVIRNLSLGVNASYLFGNIYEDRSVNMPEDSNYLNIGISNKLNVRGLKLDLGLQYELKLKNDINLVLGGAYYLQNDLYATNTLLTTRYKSYETAESDVIVKDTLYDDLKNSGKVRIPGGFAGGFVLNKANVWNIGVDITKSNWSRYQEFGKNDSLVDVLALAVGMEWIPNYKALNKYYQKIAYRIGGRYESDYFKINNETTAGFGITFGLGLPIMHRAAKPSYVNLGVEMGYKGEAKQKMIKEEYLRFVVGFSFYDHWFYKRKYD